MKPPRKSKRADWPPPRSSTSWAIEDEYIDDEDTFYVLMACRRHAVHGTWGSTHVRCGICPPEARPNRFAVVSTAGIDAEPLLREGRRRFAVAAYAALGVMSSPSLHIPVASFALVPTCRDARAVLDALREREDLRELDPEDVVRAALETAGF